jgi:MFS family permease
MTALPPPRTSGISARSLAAPAFRSRDFRLFWLGQLISTAGTALQVVAEGWLVYDLTRSTLWLGLVGFLALLPVIPLSFLGGVLIDRVPRRKLILATQLGLMLQATVFGLLAWTGRLQLWHIIVLYAVFGALLALDHPARRAFLVDIVERDALANAVALNAALFNVASLIGYAASGFLIAGPGPATAMFLNAASYLAPIAALLAIRTPDIRHDTVGAPVRTAWKAGLAALWERKELLVVMALMAAAGGLAWPAFAMLPAFTEEVLGAGAVSLGLLWASGALGAVAGTAAAARLGLRRRGQSLTLAAFLLPLCVLGLARASQLAIACILMAGIGLMLLIVQSLAVTLIQVNTADRIRGRVMVVYSQLHAGADTAGNLGVGALAARAGLPAALGAAGLLALGLAAGLSVLAPGVRRLD